MNEIFTFAGIILIVAGIVIPMIVKSRGGESKKSLRSVLVILGVVVLLGGQCFAIIPTGYSGVRSTFGQISNQSVPQGINLKIPFIQSIDLVNNKQQDVTVPAQVWGESSEKVPVYASDIVVTFQISASKSAWIYANVTNTAELVSQSIVASAIKSAMTELSAAEVTLRSRIEPLAKERLAASMDEKYGEGTVSVLKVVINQMDFEDSYNRAIAEKSVAQQNQQKQEIENQTAIAKAEADRKVAVEKAQAEADALKISAQAEAEAKLIRAEAEAKANKIISESLTEQVIRAMFYETWDGVLPKVMSDGTLITSVDGYTGE
ncbi:MAG: hypothetical protein IKS28_03140 [Clostridia bacterium]|nr:hypothetical protein [Clostridia bacterium]